MFICGKQNRIRSLFPDDGVNFPISKGRAFVNKRVTAVNTLTERPAVVMVLFLFALTTAYLLSQVNVFDLEQPHRNVVVDGLCADRHLEQIHTLGTPADRIRRVLVFENGVFYIPDEVLCCVKFGRFSGVLTIALIAHLTGLCKILLIVRPKGKNPLKGQTFSLDISFGTSKSYSRMENTTTEYAGSRIASGGNTNISAGERDLTVRGSIVIGNDVSLTAKGKVRLEAGENTNITTTENKFSSASIGASFTPSGLTDISINANKANGNSKESVTSYSPALVSAKNDLSLTSGKDMDIIGSKAQGEKITAKVGGSLNIETLQEKETYEEDNHSTGFGVSWNVNQTKRETTDANGNTKIETLRSFSKPTFSGSWNKGNIDSHYRSARDQAGFFAGKGGFDIYVEKNTDLKGAVIASEASPEKNKLTTGTLTFSDLENTASYKVSDKGVSLHVGGNVKPGDKGLLPATHMPIHGSASNVTKSAVSSGAIEILRRPIQDLAGLSRNTDNAQKPLEKIFDKDKILEQQEAAELFGELANRAVGDISERMHWKEGDPRKIFLKGLTAGIMNRIAGGSFGKGMTAGAVNELLIARLLSWQDAYGHPIIPMELLQGISYGAGMAIDGTEGAVIAQSGTKHNIFEHLEYFLDEQEREAFLKAVEACGGDEYEVAQVFEQGAIYSGHLAVLEKHQLRDTNMSLLSIQKQMAQNLLESLK